MGLVVIVVQYFGWDESLFLGLLTVPYVILMPVEPPRSEQFRGMAWGARRRFSGAAASRSSCEAIAGFHRDHAGPFRRGDYVPQR